MSASTTVDNRWHGGLDRVRLGIDLGCGLFGVVLVWVMGVTLPGTAAEVLLDKHTDGSGLYPHSLQAAMWIVMCIGIGEIVQRARSGNFEIRQLGRHYLPEDRKTLFRAEDLGPLYRRLREDTEAPSAFLGRMIERVILQFQSSRSIEQASTLLRDSVEMYVHEIDLRYSLLRYLAWLMPSLGFIGTVYGLGSALRWAGEHAGADTLLTGVIGRLGVSFNGTLVALVLAACLALLANLAQAREEYALNRAAQYCLDNLINRLYEPK